MVNFRYVFATAVIVFGSSFQFGFQTGVINNPLILIKSFIRQISENRSGDPSDNYVSAMSTLIVAGFPVGGIFGALFGGTVSNKMGRKLSLFIFNVPMIVGSLLMMACQVARSFEMVVVGRILVGFACGAFTGIAPVYLAEIAPVNIRGMSGIMHQLAIVSALLFSQILGIEEIMGTDDLWPYLLGLTIVPAVVLLLLLWICPDSPRYILLNSQDPEGAKSALRWLRGTDNDVIEAEVEELLAEKSGRQEDERNKFGWKELFSQKALRLALFIAIVAHLAQQFSGITAVFSYSTLLFDSIGLKKASITTTVGVGITMVIVTVISIFLIERIGRRILLIGGLCVMLISAIFVTVGLALRYQNSNLAYMAIAFLFIFIGGFAIGPGSIPWFLAAEMFTQDVRDPAVIITVIVNWVAQIIVLLIFPSLLNGLREYSFVPFICLLAIFIGLLFFFLPETRGLSPRQVQDEFSRMASRKRGSGQGPPSLVSGSCPSNADDIDDRSEKVM